jgi:N-acetylglucosaminyl-diphospho-decaprenol L-rhamnosyltransferase
MTETPLASTAVVTVTYNSNDYLRGFLESIRTGDAAGVMVVVADNGSDNLSELRATCRSFDATLLELAANLGYGGAINEAVETLPAHITAVLISNPDVEFERDSITELVNTLTRVPDAGSVGPRVLNPDGTVYPSARRLPSLRTGVGHALFGQVWPSNPWTRRYLSDAYEASTMSSVGWLSGSCVLVRRHAFESIGGFDSAFFMYFEDVDLGYRLGKSGWRNMYMPDASVLHTGAHSTSAESQRMLRAHHESAYRYLEKKYSAPYLAPLRLVLKIGLKLRLALLGRRTTNAARRGTRSRAE